MDFLANFASQHVSSPNRDAATQESAMDSGNEEQERRYQDNRGASDSEEEPENEVFLLLLNTTLDRLSFEDDNEAIQLSEEALAPVRSGIPTEPLPCMYGAPVGWKPPCQPDGWMPMLVSKW